MSGVGVRSVTVLYDEHCNLCRTARSWLERQEQVVPILFVPAGSPEARTRWPALDPAMTLEDLTVIGDGGQVWVGAKAWVVCLWALRGRQRLAQRLAREGNLPKARALITFVSRHRSLLGTYDAGCACTPAT